jgi:DNA-binding MarR family transcriptional regulator
MRTDQRTKARLSRAEHQVLALLRQRPQLSYDEMVAQLEIDRRTAIQTIHKLESRRRLVKVAGSGKIPNRYLLTDSLIVWD